MTGRVLSEEEKVKEWFEKSVFYVKANGWIPAEMGIKAHGIMQTQLATIRDRKKTIAELDRQYAVVATKAINLELQNEVMLSAFERILANEFSTWTLGGFIRDTIAQVKALTVSKQEVSTVSEVACEQTNKDSLKVARQNNPTHPTKHMSKLAAEVESDMRWKEGEPK